RATVGPALAGCQSALFLVHGMGSGAADYPEHERLTALAFREAAEAEGLRRVVYLGGVAPPGRPSKHLKSRLDTGEVLRAGVVSTIELRAAMIVGVGGSSWLMVRDLAKRLPAMLLPRWLLNHSWPVSIDDVVAALLLALRRPGDSSDWYDVPGPERVSHRDLLGRVVGLMGKSARMISIPILSPRLSSYWIGLVTRADLSLARELVEGLRYDLDPSGPSIWELAQDHRLHSLDDMIRDALKEEGRHFSPTIEHSQKLEALGARFAGGA
ncbi:MAG: Rossmann-fold NAD(P)-binding domain-containing protein, partial [Planctomycetota bacterium]